MIAARVCCRRLNNSSVWKRADDLNLLMILLDFCNSMYMIIKIKKKLIRLVNLNILNFYIEDFHVQGVGKGIILYPLTV